MFFSDFLTMVNIIFLQALEAVKMVLELSSYKRVDIELLDKILTKIEEYGYRSSSSCHVAKDQDICASQEDSVTDYGGDSENIVPVFEERERELLVSIIGGVMQQVHMLDFFFIFLMSLYSLSAFCRLFDP